MKPVIGLLLGDPTGIGPELIAKLLALPDIEPQAEVVILGDRRVYERGLEVARVADTRPRFLEVPAAAANFPTGKLSVEAGAHTLETLKEALRHLAAGAIDGVVYAPLNKQAMKRAGLGHEDELHLFAELLGHAGPVSEINVCGPLWTSRVTSHVPLKDVSGLIQEEKICEAAWLLQRALVRGGVAEPRMAVAALNPHAGEGGLIGTEEMVTIGPAVERLRREGMNATGPLPADTLFVAARRGDYDGVVTMYHDQGQIAMKLMGFERGVTVAGGVPAVIATPAHGTAFDIAGKGIADVGALREAFLVACAAAARIKTLID